jgi:hypothetical protein
VPDRPLVRRRTVVTGLAATVLLAGCDTGDDISPPESSGSSPATAEATEATGQTPDQALVDGVLVELTSALAVLAQARRASLLRKAVIPLTRAHRQHVRVLEGELTNQSPSGPAPDPAVSLRLVRQSERRLHVTLVDAAGRAESGALARLLASMSASVTQHLFVLPSEVGT